MEGFSRLPYRVAACMERTQIVSLAPDILAAVVPVLEAFEHYGVAYFIGGSVASSMYGMPRSTMDVDLVADVRPEQVQPLVERLQTAYYIDEQAMREAIDRRSSFNLIHLATMLKVDVFVPKARAFDREMFDRIHREQLIDGEAAQAFSLPSAEDMVLAKLEWYRLGGEASERQWMDVLGILKVQAPTLDTAYLQRWATPLNLVDLLDRALDDAGLTGASQ